MTTPEEALHRLLVASFDVGGLLRFVRLGPRGREVASELPSSGVSVAELAFEVVVAYRQRNRLPELFERLLEKRPGRELEIREVRRMFEALDSAPDSAAGRAPDRHPERTMRGDRWAQDFEQATERIRTGPSLPTLVRGDVLSRRFELEIRLGEDRVGGIWRARDLSESQEVALHVLHGHHLQDPQKLERFFEAVACMASVDHPAATRVVLERGEHRRYRYFAVEFFERLGLFRMVQGGGLDGETALEHLLEAGRAVAAAHRKDLVHGELRPQAILVDRGGRTRISNFGLARALDALGGPLFDRGGMADVYTAPEIWARRAEPDAASDQYGLAMVAVFCLYGRELPPEVLREPENILREVGVHEALVEALHPALSWDPGGRYESVEALCEALHRARLASREAVRAPDRPPDRPRLPSTLVGREAVLETCDALLEGLGPRCQRRQTPPTLLVIEGAVGMGKTAIAREVLRRAEQRGCRVARATAHPSRRYRCYDAWTRILCSVLHLDAEDTGWDRHARLAQSPVTRSLPIPLRNLLHRLLRAEEPPDDSPSGTRGDERLAPVRSTLLRFLQELTAACPLVVVLDETAHLDAASWRLAEGLLEEGRNLLLVLTRDTSPGAEEPEPLARLAGHSSALRLRLQPLSEKDARTLLEQPIPGAGTADAFLEELFAPGGGNPLSLRLLAGLAAGTGASKAPLPATLDHQVDALLARRSPEERERLERIAVLGSPFSLSALRDVEFRGIGSSRTTREHLEKLVRDGLLEGEGGEMYRVFHPRLEERATRGIQDEGTRAALHRTVAHMLAHQADHRGIPEPERIAHHLARADCAQEAREYLAQAAHHAEAIGDAEAVLTLLERSEALDRFPKDSEERSGDPSEDVQLAEALHCYRQGTAHHHLGALDHAEERLMQALRALDETLPPKRRNTPAPWWVLLCWRVRLRYQWWRIAWRSRHRRPPENARRKHRELALRVLVRLSEVRYFGRQDRYLATLTAIARMLGQAPVRHSGRPLAWLGYALGTPRFSRAASRCFTKARLVSGNHGRPGDRVMIRVVEAALHLNTGAWEEGRTRLDEARDITTTHTVGYGVDFARTLMALDQTLQGRYRDAYELFRAMERDARASNRAIHLTWALYGQAGCLLQLGNHREALILVDRALLRLDRWPEQPSLIACHAIRALCLSRLHRTVEADAAAFCAECLIQETIYPVGLVLMDAYSALLEYHFRRLESADGSTPTQERRARFCWQEMRRMARLYPAARVRQDLLAARYHLVRQRRWRARRRALRALSGARVQGFRYDEARALVILAEAGHRDARRLRQEAVEIFEELGCPPDLEEQQQVLTDEFPPDPPAEEA